MSPHRLSFPKYFLGLLALVAVPAFAVEIRCGRGETLQGAIDGLRPGGVVSFRGECLENVVVTTDHITIEGADASAQLTAVRGGGLYGHALTILAHGVTVDGLTILGAVLVEDGGDNRLLDSAPKGSPVAIRVLNGELEVRDTFTSGWLLAGRGAEVNVHDSHISGRVEVYGSSFVGLEDTNISTNDLALSTLNSFLGVSGGEIDSVVALDAQYSTVVFSAGMRFTGSLRAVHSKVQIDNHVEQLAGGVNYFSRSTLDSEYENTLLDTVLGRHSSASLHFGTQVTSLTCGEASVAYCSNGAVVDASTCGNCPATK